MAQTVISSPIRDIWADSSSPISLTTTVTNLWRDPGAEEVEFYADADFRLIVAPYLLEVVFYDDSAATYTQGAKEAQDGDTTTVALTLNSMEGGADYIYLKCDEPITGFYADLTNLNSTGSVMTVSYWKTQTTPAWADTGDTDGTIATTAKTFGQDGLVYWTQPSDEIQCAPLTGYGAGFWYRIGVDTTLDTSVTLIQLLALNRKHGTRRPVVVFKGDTYHTFSMNNDAVAGFMLDHATATATLNVNWIRHGRSAA